MGYLTHSSALTTQCSQSASGIGNEEECFVLELFEKTELFNNGLCGELLYFNVFRNSEKDYIKETANEKER